MLHDLVPCFPLSLGYWIGELLVLIACPVFVTQAHMLNVDE